MANDREELAAERTVAMMQMHVIIGLVANTARAFDDPAVVDELIADMLSLVQRITEPAEPELLEGTSIRPADVVRKARARAEALVGAIRIGVEATLAANPDVTH